MPGCFPPPHMLRAIMNSEAATPEQREQARKTLEANQKLQDSYARSMEKGVEEQNRRDEDAGDAGAGKSDGEGGKGRL
ncbi:hypothetical protein EsH8_X_000481 [Colletotrichum jinshuiense]